MSDQQWTPGDDDTRSGGGAPPPPPPPPSGGPPVGSSSGSTTSAVPDLGKRFLARFIDWVILWVVYMVLGFIVFAAAVSDAASGGGGMMGGMFGGFSFGGIILGLIPGAYFIGMLAFNDGKTIGKAVLGLQVRTTDGGPLDIGRAFQREWWNLLIVIPFIGGLAAAAMAIFIAVTINNKQPWHDQQANTTEIVTK